MRWRWLRRQPDITTSLIAPMRRGLKLISSVRPAIISTTSLIAPMRRGLKLLLRCAADSFIRHFTHCPDEEGTEMYACQFAPPRR